MTARGLVQTAQKQGGRLRGSDENVQSVSGGVVEKEQSDAACPRDASAEVFAVAQQHLHAMRVLKAAGVALRPTPFAPPHIFPHALESAVDGGAVGALVGL